MHVDILNLVDNILHMHFLTGLELLGMPFRYINIEIYATLDNILI